MAIDARERAAVRARVRQQIADLRIRVAAEEAEKRATAESQAMERRARELMELQVRRRGEELERARRAAAERAEVELARREVVAWMMNASRATVASAPAAALNASGRGQHLSKEEQRVRRLKLTVV